MDRAPRAPGRTVCSKTTPLSRCTCSQPDLRALFCPPHGVPGRTPVRGDVHSAREEEEREQPGVLAAGPGGPAHDAGAAERDHRLRSSD